MSEVEEQDQRLREEAHSRPGVILATHNPPDCVPHVEAIQRLGTIGAPSCQTHQRWQPVRDVDEFAADGPGVLQQRAGHESNSPDPSFP